jgi:hypothetical protein
MKSVLPTFKSVARQRADAAFARLRPASAPQQNGADQSSRETSRLREAVRRGLLGSPHRREAGVVPQ